MANFVAYRWSFSLSTNPKIVRSGVSAWRSDLLSADYGKNQTRVHLHCGLCEKMKLFSDIFVDKNKIKFHVARIQL